MKKVKIANKAMEKVKFSDLNIGLDSKGGELELLSAVMKLYDKAVVVDWSMKNCGFGQYTVYLNDENKEIIDDECLGEAQLKVLMEGIRNFYRNKKLKIEHEKKCLIDWKKHFNLA